MGHQSPRWFKLNVDGSAREGECSGGGIIRDGHGYLVVAFSVFYGPGTNNFAEFCAVKIDFNMQGIEFVFGID